MRWRSRTRACACSDTRATRAAATRCTPGILAARGNVIVTTEIDLSWGETIVHDLVDAMTRWPDADIVVASPNLPGGGYKHVPAKRVWISRFGNRVIRLCMANAVTMNTGMTRAYRRDVIQSLPLTEPGKEFHLEVILKATVVRPQDPRDPRRARMEGAQAAGDRSSSARARRR